jgi:hypothetical protein
VEISSFLLRQDRRGGERQVSILCEGRDGIMEKAGIGRWGLDPESKRMGTGKESLPHAEVT